MKKLFPFAKLVRLIAVRGKVRATGFDYSKRRSETLKALQQFCPEGIKREPKRSSARKWIEKNPYIRGWVGQAAFLKNALMRKGGHLWVPELDLCYVRNPRAASTALSYAMLQKKYVHLKGFEISNEEINFLSDVNMNFRVTAEQKEAVYFTVVRNPFARIVSVYREFVAKSGNGFIYQDYLFGILAKGLSFNDFLRRLLLIPDWLKDQHITPQCMLLRYYRREKIQVRVFKLEEPAALNVFLSAFQLNLPSAATPAYDYRQYYDQQSLEIVHDLYHGDITSFNYEQTYLDLKAFI